MGFCQLGPQKSNGNKGVVMWRGSTVLYKVVLTFESVDEILKGDHSNERY